MSIAGKGNPEMLLASGSPRRKELLQLLGIPFQVVVPAIREDDRQDEAGAAQACALADKKALAIARQSPTHLVIAADTLVVLQEQILGKPADAASALAMLRALRGREHRVISAVAIAVPGRSAPQVQAVETKVWMRDYDDDEIDNYVARGEPFDKAGAYAIQDLHFHPVELIDGCYANVMGLPLCHLFVMLTQHGLVPRPRQMDPHRACEKHLRRKCGIAERILEATTH